jgi:hypothetical protein
LLVPSSAAPARGPQPAPTQPANLHQARDNLSSTVATRRAERTALWQDSTVFQDSFFAPDSRLDGFGSSEFASLTGGSASKSGKSRGGSSHPASGESASPEPEPDDVVGGVVVDVPRFSSGSRR